ncbi:MAG: hypothetical protein WBD55_05495 [Dehalococcoidia bacterium]
MRIPLLLAALLTAFALIASACGDSNNGTTGAGGSPTAIPLSNEGITPIAANSELAVGPNRFGLGLIDEDNKPILDAPGTSVALKFYYQDKLKSQADARFVWAIPDVAGLFVADVEFDQAGTWEAEATLTQSGDETKVRRFNFPVLAQGRAPTIGGKAPPSENLTINDVSDIAQISTDETPNTAFYQMTVAQALEAGKPFVVIFATPKFCQTRFCGPILDNIKAIAPDFADQVTFIHIEPYELDANGDLVVGSDGFPKPVQATSDWGLISEPWIFVVDAAGTVTARFEGAASPAELSAAIQPLVP